MTGVVDAAHQFRLNHLDMAVPDGQPVRWALKLLHGVPLPIASTGQPDTKGVRGGSSASLSVFFYGSHPTVLAALSAICRCGTQDCSGGHRAVALPLPV